MSFAFRPVTLGVAVVGHYVFGMAQLDHYYLIFAHLGQIYLEHPNRAKMSCAAHVFGLNLRKLKYNNLNLQPKTPKFDLIVGKLEFTGLNIPN